MVCTDVAEDELVMDLHELNQDHASNDEDVNDDGKVVDDMDSEEINTEPNDNIKLEDLKPEVTGGPLGRTPTTKKIASKSNTSKSRSDGNGITAKEIKEVQRDLLDKQTEVQVKLEKEKQEFQS